MSKIQRLPCLKNGREVNMQISLKSRRDINYYSVPYRNANLLRKRIFERIAEIKKGTRPADDGIMAIIAENSNGTYVRTFFDVMEVELIEIE